MIHVLDLPKAVQILRDDSTKNGDDPSGLSDSEIFKEYQLVLTGRITKHGKSIPYITAEDNCDSSFVESGLNLIKECLDHEDWIECDEDSQYDGVSKIEFYFRGGEYHYGYISECHVPTPIEDRMRKAMQGLIDALGSDDVGAATLHAHRLRDGLDYIGLAP
jgi:hypothetical protein